MHGKEEAPAIRILEEAGEDVGRLEYRFVERGGTKDAARQLGLCEHDIVKSLVFDDGKGGQAVMALMHGDERVSLHKLQRLSGVPHLQPSGRARRHRRHPARGPAAFRGRGRRHSEWRTPAIALDDVYGERLFGVRYI